MREAFGPRSFTIYLLIQLPWVRHAGMAELADAQDLGSCEAIRVGSTPTTRTTPEQHKLCSVIFII